MPQGLVLQPTFNVTSEGGGWRKKGDTVCVLCQTLVLSREIGAAASSSILLVACTTRLSEFQATYNNCHKYLIYAAETLFDHRKCK